MPMLSRFGRLLTFFLSDASPCQCSNRDLHRYGAELLDRYGVCCCVGHDEYWTGVMRDHMEAWLGEGGRCARFAGNFCERQAFSNPVHCWSNAAVYLHNSLMLPRGSDRICRRQSGRCGLSRITTAGRRLRSCARTFRSATSTAPHRRIR